MQLPARAASRAAALGRRARCATKRRTSRPLIAEIRAALAGVAPRDRLCRRRQHATTRRRAAGRCGARPGRCAGGGIAASCGQSAAIVTGVRAARGEWIATLDGDGQNDPADIPRLLRARAGRQRAGPVLIAGHGTTRRDSRIKRLSSRVANARPRPRCCGDATPDTGCGLKLFRRDGVPRAAAVRPHAPLPAGAVPARRRPGRSRCRSTTGRARGPLQLRHAGPAVGGHRSIWRACAGCSAAGGRRWSSAGAARPVNAAMARAGSLLWRPALLLGGLGGGRRLAAAQSRLERRAALDRDSPQRQPLAFVLVGRCAVRRRRAASSWWPMPPARVRLLGAAWRSRWRRRWRAARWICLGARRWRADWALRRLGRGWRGSTGCWPATRSPPR